MKQILVVKQINEKPIQKLLYFDITNVVHFELCGIYRCDTPLDLKYLFTKYNISHHFSVDTLVSFSTFSQINLDGEHIWIHAEGNKDYEALLRILKINEIIKHDTIS